MGFSVGWLVVAGNFPAKEKSLLSFSLLTEKSILSFLGYQTEGCTRLEISDALKPMLNMS